MSDSVLSPSAPDSAKPTRRRYTQAYKRRLPRIGNKVKIETSGSFGRSSSEEITIYGEPDPGDSDGGRVRHSGSRGLPQTRYQLTDVLPVEEQIRRDVSA